MDLKEAFTIQEVASIIVDDPVRRHINPAFRLGNGARVFYYGTPENALAAVCMHTSRVIPDSEEELLSEYHTGGARLSGTKAIFYTVWSHKKGMGRQIINTTLSQLILEGYHDQYVTLSPTSDLVRQFHEGNGAKLIRSSLYANNYEYKVYREGHEPPRTRVA